MQRELKINLCDEKKEENKLELIKKYNKLQHNYNLIINIYGYRYKSFLT